MTEREALKAVAALLSGHRHRWAREAWLIAVDALAASGIEAPSGGETGNTGSTEGESPVGEADAPTTHHLSGSEGK